MKHLVCVMTMMTVVVVVGDLDLDLHLFVVVVVPTFAAGGGLLLGNVGGETKRAGGGSSR